MAFVYRLIFDISVYYIITGVYLPIWFQTRPFGPGLLLLCLALLMYGWLYSKKMLGRWRSFLLLIPAAMIFFRPELGDWIHFLPAWGYCSFLLINDRADMEYNVFYNRVFKSVMLVVLLLVPAFFTAIKRDGVFRYIPGYVLLYVISGAACLRSLRDRDGSVRHLLVILAFVAACAVLYYLRIHQLLITLFSDYILKGLVYAVGSVVIWFLSLLVGSERSSEITGAQQREPVQQQGSTVVAGVPFTVDERVAKWVDIVLYAALGAAALVLLIKLIKYLIKSGKQVEDGKPQSVWKEEVSYLRKPPGSSRRKRKKTQDPRMAVRYYYWRYMSECEKRGIAVRKGWTCEELGEASEACFLKEDIAAMQKLYGPVRYDDGCTVTGKQARQAAKLWQSLKKSKMESR